MIEVAIVVHLRRNRKVSGWRVTDRVPLAVCSANMRRPPWKQLTPARLKDRRVVFHNFDRSQYCHRFGYINTWAAPRNVS